MKFAHKHQATRIKNGEKCSAVEYPIGDKDINGTIIELAGRYPSKGRVVNLVCKELVYIVRGSGSIVVEGSNCTVSEGDEVLIEPGEQYYWEGRLSAFVSCFPAWYQDQHKEVI